MTFCELETGEIFTLGGTLRFMRTDRQGEAVHLNGSQRGVTTAVAPDCTIDRRWVNGGRRPATVPK